MSAIIFSSCRFLHTCDDMLEEGIALAIEWCSMPFILETDCAVAAQMIMQTKKDRSPGAALVEIKRLLNMGREHAISVIRCSRNSVAHSLAQMGHNSTRTAVWLRSVPQDIHVLAQNDCDHHD